MQFTVNVKEFKAIITEIAKVLPKRPTHPILEYLLIETSEEIPGFIRVTGTNLSVFVELQCDAIITNVGAIAVNAKQLLAILKEAKGNISFMHLDDELVVNANGIDYRPKFEAAKNFVEVPRFFIDSQKIAIPMLLEGIQRTSYAASTDETKQVLTGVHFQFTEKQITFESTDGHRLAQFTFEDESPKFLNEVTIPASTLSFLEKLLKKSKEKSIELSVDSGMAKISWNQGWMIARILEGQYPDFEYLIPRDFSKTISVDKQQLIDGVKSVMVLAKASNKLISLDIKENSMDIVLPSEETNKTSKIINCNLIGEQILITFESKYLVEALEQLPGEKVLINLNDPLDYAVFNPSEPTEIKHLSLIAPVEVKTKML